VKEISEAARRHGLKFGIYLSPWDRNNPSYGKPEYVALYRAQLTELLTGYGPIFEVWHDGANGGDGYYGGAREKRIIDKQTYYQWPATWELVRSLAPDAVVFSDAGPDVRWVGNEKGIAGDPCWATFDPIAANGGPGMPGDTNTKSAATGNRLGARWMPAECDVSIRPGWFWHESDNARVKTPDQLLDLYFHSVGRGAHLLLNVPPDRRGLLHESDLASLRAFGERIRGMFRQNIARHAKTTAAEIIVDLPHNAAFQLIRLREKIELGQRVDAFALDYSRGKQWQTFFEGTSIGACRLVRLDQPLSAHKLRLRVTASRATPAIQEFSVFDPNVKTSS
jgi:alpha-L-fucosidase